MFLTGPEAPVPPLVPPVPCTMSCSAVSVPSFLAPARIFWTGRRDGCRRRAAPPCGQEELDGRAGLPSRASRRRRPRCRAPNLAPKPPPMYSQITRIRDAGILSASASSSRTERCPGSTPRPSGRRPPSSRRGRASRGPMCVWTCGGVGPLDDGVRLGEALLDVALGERPRPEDVARCAAAWTWARCRRRRPRSSSRPCPSNTSGAPLCHRLLDRGHEGAVRRSRPRIARSASSASSGVSAATAATSWPAKRDLLAGLGERQRRLHARASSRGGEVDRLAPWPRRRGSAGSGRRAFPGSRTSIE